MDIYCGNLSRVQNMRTTTFFVLTQDSCLSQHVLEPTRRENVLVIVLSTQQEFADNVKTEEPLGVAIITRYYLPSM